MQMWPGQHIHDEFDGAMEASRMASMLQHVPLAMSLCRVDYANHLKMQSSISNHMYAPSAFEGYVPTMAVPRGMVEKSCPPPPQSEVCPTDTQTKHLLSVLDSRDEHLVMLTDNFFQ